MIADVSGYGETRVNEKLPDWMKTVGPAWQEYYRAYLCGISMVYLRTEDMLLLADLMRHRKLPVTRESGMDYPLEIRADGALTVPGLHAAALQPEWFSKVQLRGGIPSWEAVVRAGKPRAQLDNAVHGALEHYDLPELAATLPEGLLDWQPGTVPEF